MQADKIPVKIVGKFLLVDTYLINPASIRCVELVSKWYQDDAYDAVVVFCLLSTGEYSKDLIWSFGKVKVRSGLDDRNCVVYAPDPQADIHNAEARKFFEKICSALALLTELEE